MADFVDSNGSEGLMTIGPGGEVPECRMKDAAATQDVVRRLTQNDSKRSRKRALVDGLVDGNPPWSPRKLREANSSQRTNVNWGTARAYMESGVGAFYDLFSQAPGYIAVTTEHGTPQERIDYSRIMSEEADRMFGDDPDWDNDMQLSQGEMVLHGTGPLYFEDAISIFPVAIGSGDLLVPERTRSKLSRHELDVIRWDYYPPELYEFIRDEKAAKAVGWDVEYTKSVIQNAIYVRQPESNLMYSWEWYQNELKSNSWNYIDDAKICRVAHVFWREFSGRITHAIVERETTASSQGNGPEDKPQVKYLFLHVERYASMEEAIHPMYCDRGREGYHHNVTGLGVKQYGPMEQENRTLCSIVDKADAPKILFKPTTAEAAVKFQLARFGDFGVVPPGTEALQTPIQGFITDGIALFRTTSELMRSNLSGYRQPVQMDKPGNPQTAFKEKLDASQQSSVSGTTFNRYYKQLDALYTEIARRMFNLNTTDNRAVEVQQRCIARGVKRECFGRIGSVKAVRVVGEGNPFMRQQAVQSVAQIIGGCPEDGQTNWRNDYIAAHCGQSGIARYNPKPETPKLPSDQRERAMNQVTGMKVGLQPTPTSSQNALTFAGVFLEAAVAAVQSLQKGANSQEVLSFLTLAGPAIHLHIQRMSGDPMKHDIVKELLAQWKKLAGITDQIKAQVQKQAQQQQAQQQKQGGAMTDIAIKAMTAQAQQKLKEEKQKHAQALKTAVTRQNLQIADAEAASRISLDHAKTQAIIHTNRLKALASKGGE